MPNKWSQAMARTVPIVRYSALALICLTTLLQECHACGTERPLLSEVQVLQIASDAARKAGKDLFLYKTPGVGHVEPCLTIRSSCRLRRDSTQALGGK